MERSKVSFIGRGRWRPSYKPQHADTDVTGNIVIGSMSLRKAALFMARLLYLSMNKEQCGEEDGCAHAGLAYFTEPLV